MVYKNLKRLISLALVVMMIVSLTACGVKGKETGSDQEKKDSSEKASSEGDSSAPDSGEGSAISEITLPITDEKVTLSYWFPWDATVSNVISNNNETLTCQKMEELTGVHIEYIHPTIGSEQEIFSVLIASGDYPDMIYLANGAAYPGGIVGGIDDGVFLNINDLVQQYAPNFSGWREYDDVHRIETISDDGFILGFPMMNEEGEPANLGMVIRQDKLDLLGMEVPETLDEIYSVLKAAHDKLGMKSPLLLPGTGVFEDSNILSAFGVGKDWYQDNGTVKYGPIQEGYKQYLQLMNQWYSEGLIDPNFVSNSFTGAPPNDLLVSEDVMMTTTFWGRTVDAMVVNGVTENKDFWMTPMPAAKQKKGDTVGIRTWNSPILSQTVVTSGCKNPEIAVKWLDYQYTKDAMILNNYGVEGFTFNYDEKGDFQFTDLIMNNPDGLNPTDANRLYIRRNGSGWIDYKRQWLTNPTVKHKDQVWAYDTWSEDSTEQVIPNVTFSTLESQDYASAYSDIETYMREMTVKFIMGVTSLNDWDTYVSTIQSMGIEDCTKLKQLALDRYYNR